MLKIRFKDNKYNAVWLVEPKITIGRSATNALVIDDPEVNDLHLEVLVDNEHLTLRNLARGQGVSVNGQTVTGACELKPGDALKVGKTELVVIDPKQEARQASSSAGQATQVRLPAATGWSLKANHAALAGKVFPLQRQTTIGRSSECDICLPAAHLSRRHAQLNIIDGLLYVKDLGSANGTFLNGKRVAEARVKRGDELRFDALSFGVIGPSDDLAKTTVRKPLVQANGQPTIRRKPAPSRSQVSPLVQASSVRSAAHNTEPREEGEAAKGKFGLVLLAALAIIVITTLILTRK